MPVNRRPRQAGRLQGQDQADLARLGWQTWGYLLVAASVPLLAILLLVLIHSESRFALGVLSTAGLAGLGRPSGWPGRSRWKGIEPEPYALSTKYPPPQGISPPRD